MTRKTGHEKTVQDQRRLTAGLPTTSAKIRALHEAGYSRTEIAQALNIRYQHVRNVLVQDQARKGQFAEAPAGPYASQEAQAPPMARVRVGPDGRLVIPAPFREALGLKDGDTLLARLDDGEIRLLTIPASVRKAQAIVRRFVPEGVSLVDELIAERRREVERESRHD